MGGRVIDLGTRWHAYHPIATHARTQAHTRCSLSCNALDRVPPRASEVIFDPRGGVRLAIPADLHAVCRASATARNYPRIELAVTRQEPIGPGPAAWREFLDGATIHEAGEAALLLDDAPR